MATKQELVWWLLVVCIGLLAIALFGPGCATMAPDQTINWPEENQWFPGCPEPRIESLSFGIDDTIKLHAAYVRCGQLFPDKPCVALYRKSPTTGHVSILCGEKKQKRRSDGNNSKVRKHDYEALPKGDDTP